jgi:hypothetical protein
LSRIFAKLLSTPQYPIIQWQNLISTPSLTTILPLSIGRQMPRSVVGDSNYIAHPAEYFSIQRWTFLIF